MLCLLSWAKWKAPYKLLIKIWQLSLIEIQLSQHLLSKFLQRRITNSNTLHIIKYQHHYPLLVLSIVPLISLDLPAPQPSVGHYRQRVGMAGSSSSPSPEGLRWSQWLFPRSVLLWHLVHYEILLKTMSQSFQEHQQALNKKKSTKKWLSEIQMSSSPSPYCTNYHLQRHQL